MSAGAWPEYYLLDPVMVMGDGDTKVAWSSGPDVCRIIPHVLALPASSNAICPMAATAWCSWNELLEARERFLGRKVERVYRNATFLPDFRGTPLPELFRDRIEPFVAAVRAELIASGELPPDE